MPDSGKRDVSMRNKFVINLIMNESVNMILLSCQANCNFDLCHGLPTILITHSHLGRLPSLIFTSGAHEYC